VSKSNLLFNFFKKSKLDTHYSVQELHEVYKLYRLGGSNISFINFIIFVNTFSENYSNRNLFLALLFFGKTPSVLRISPVNSKLDFLLASSRIVTLYTDPAESLRIINSFWRRVKALRRPKTEENFDEYFLTEWKKKLSIYEKLNFIVLENSFNIVRCKSEKFVKTFVTVNKPLLVAPKLSSSSLHKLFNLSSVTNLEFQYLRKNKVYNKGRYSRCRQNYRTGVYMCMYLSVVSIFGLYYWFYKFSFNFTYLWWFFIVFVGSFFLPKIIKYRLYEPTTIVTKVFDFFKWFFLVLKSLF
jgi:hypothetical protein